MPSIEQRVTTLEGGPAKLCSVCLIGRELASLDSNQPPPSHDQQCPHPPGWTFADELKGLPTGDAG